jgi:hypothetical protein
MIHNPKDIFFIKLGMGGQYETECIEKNNTIKLGYDEISHDLCIKGEWDTVLSEIQNKYKTWPSATTSHRNQVRRFYEEPEETLWITFYKNKLWHCYAKREIILNPDGTKERKTLNGWSDSDTNGKQLFIQALSGRLTKVQGFRGTICDIKEKIYLLHKINGTQSPELIAVEESVFSLKKALTTLLRSLNWKDFETLVDLIFRAAGWSRIGVAGKTVKTIDLELISPVTNERALVQIKSESNLQTFIEYKDKFKDMAEYEKYFFIVHTPSADLRNYIESETETEVLIYDDKKLVDLCINAGLIEWLVSVAT